MPKCSNDEKSILGFNDNDQKNLLKLIVDLLVDALKNFLKTVFNNNSFY